MKDCSHWPCLLAQLLALLLVQLVQCQALCPWERWEGLRGTRIHVWRDTDVWRRIFLPQICNQNKGLEPESHKSRVCRKRCFLYQTESFLSTKDSSLNRLERPRASQPHTAAKPVRNMSRCSLLKFQAMPYNNPQSRGTERKEFQRQGGSPN